MIEFELLGVRGGWDQAVFGPSDQVEYVLHTDEGRFESYDSVHSFLKLYDLARLEEPRHPRFLGFEVSERHGGDAVVVEIHGTPAVTTYEGLRESLEPFLEAVFAGLDEETVGDRAEHVDAIADSGEVLVDLEALYDRLAGSRA